LAACLPPSLPPFLPPSLPPSLFLSLTPPLCLSRGRRSCACVEY
jgi:hypothetical protein